MTPKSYLEFKNIKPRKRSLPPKDILEKAVNCGFSLNDLARILKISRETIRNHIWVDYPELFHMFKLSGRVRQGILKKLNKDSQLQQELKKYASKD